MLDYAETLSDRLDLEKSVVCGHSRLGKTALVAAMFDERFKFSYSNDSGCSGAALATGTTGETVDDICCRFPFWFCENYKKYANNESEMPFDAIKGQLKEKLMQDKQQAAYQSKLNQLKILYPVDKF